MGAGESKQRPSPSTSLPTYSWANVPRNVSLIFPYSSRTHCDAAPPPLPPIGVSSAAAPPPPPSSAEKNSGKSSSSTQPPPPPPDASQPTETSAEKTDSISEVARTVSAEPLFPNPGPYEHATLDARRLLNLDTYDGFRCDITKQLSPYMAVVHSFVLGTTMLPDGKNKSYTFLSQVADDSGFAMARYDPANHSVDGRVQRVVLGGLGMFKLQFNTAGNAAAGDGEDGAAAVQQQPSMDQLLAELDINGGTWAANVKYGAMGGGNVYGCNYFQSITKNWAIGGEGMYLSVKGALLGNYLVKYSGTIKNKNGTDSDVGFASTSLDTIDKKDGSNSDEPDNPYSACASYNAAQGVLSLNYCRTVTPRRVSLGAELQFSPMSLDSQILFGAEFNLTRSKVCMCVDGSGRIQSTLETKLGMAPGSPSLKFAAEVDHMQDAMKFGYGLNIGG